MPCPVSALSAALADAAEAGEGKAGDAQHDELGDSEGQGGTATGRAWLTLAFGTELEAAAVAGKCACSPPWLLPLCVYVCVRVCVCVHECVHACVRVYLCACMCECMHACACVQGHLHKHGIVCVTRFCWMMAWTS